MILQVAVKRKSGWNEGAEAALELIGEHEPDEIEFSYSGEHGRWPSVRCAFAVEAMIVLRLAVSE